MNRGREWVVTIMMALGAGPLAAQAPGTATDAALRTQIGVTARALAASDDAIGLREESSVPNRAADCAADHACDMATALDSLRAAADTLREQTGQLRSDDTRLGSTFTARAAAALLPAVQALPRWDQLRGSPALQSNPGLAQKWSLSQRAVVAAMQAGVAYLKFSGADTSQLDAPLASAQPKH
jgi:hypothetical protein